MALDCLAAVSPAPHTRTHAYPHAAQMTDTEDILKGHIQFSQAPFEGIRANMLRERLHAAQGGQLSQV